MIVPKGEPPVRETVDTFVAMIVWYSVLNIQGQIAVEKIIWK